MIPALLIKTSMVPLMRYRLRDGVLNILTLADIRTHDQHVCGWVSVARWSQLGSKCRQPTVGPCLIVVLICNHSYSHLRDLIAIHFFAMSGYVTQRKRERIEKTRHDCARSDLGQHKGLRAGRHPHNKARIFERELRK